MKFFAAAVLAMCATSAYATTLGEHSATGGFCYREEEGCGPSSDQWSPLCHDGQRQSPIDLPRMLIPSGLTTLRIGSYRGNSFRLQNNGHSVSVDFIGESGANEGPSSQLFPFPDPLMVNRIGYSRQGVRQYKFASAHFHWGVNDTATGSEHCIAGDCAAMELHLVHYLANYSSMTEAVNSGDENALAVLGVLIDVSRSNRPNPALAPIVNNLNKIEIADHDSFTNINEPLDFTRLLLAENPEHMYSYKGSLTTPGCNEQVNWYVLRRPALASHSTLEAFRSMIKDTRGETLTENYRPLQSRNGRQILLSTVVPSQ